MQIQIEPFLFSLHFLCWLGQAFYSGSILLLWNLTWFQPLEVYCTVFKTEFRQGEIEAAQEVQNNEGNNVGIQMLQPCTAPHHMLKVLGQLRNLDADKEYNLMPNIQGHHLRQTANLDLCFTARQPFYKTANIQCSLNIYQTNIHKVMHTIAQIMKNEHQVLHLMNCTCCNTCLQILNQS